MKSKIILPFLTGMLLFSCKSEPGVASEETYEDRSGIQITREQFDHNRMELGQLTEMDFPALIRASGKVDVPPENLARISVFEGGYVTRIPLLEGSSVRQGQLVLSLENPKYVELQQEYLELSGQLNYLKSEFERQEIMLKENITSQKNFLKVESDFKSGQARYNGLRQKLQMLNINPEQVEAGNITSVINIYAPISGTIEGVNVSRGMYVEPTFTIMEIVNTEHLHLELQVFEKDMMKVKAGQKLRFSLPQDASATYEAEVLLVGKSLNENRIATVHADIADSLKNRFAVGMFVEAQIISSSNLQPAIPEEAIVEVDNAHYVLILEKGEGEAFEFSRREVKPLHTFNGFTSIEDPEALEGKQILTRGAFNLIGN